MYDLPLALRILRRRARLQEVEIEDRLEALESTSLDLDRVRLWEEGEAQPSWEDLLRWLSVLKYDLSNLQDALEEAQLLSEAESGEPLATFRVEGHRKLVADEDFRRRVSELASGLGLAESAPRLARLPHSRDAALGVAGSDPATLGATALETAIVIDSLVLVAADLEATCDFYTRVLGLRPSPPEKGHRGFQVGTQCIYFQPVESSGEATTPVPRPAHLRLRCALSLDLVAQKLRQQGVTFEEETPRVLLLRDPEGNLIELLGP